MLEGAWEGPRQAARENIFPFSDQTSSQLYHYPCCSLLPNKVRCHGCHNHCYTMICDSLLSIPFVVFVNLPPSRIEHIYFYEESCLLPIPQTCVSTRSASLSWVQLPTHTPLFDLVFQTLGFRFVSFMHCTFLLKHVDAAFCASSILLPTSIILLLFLFIIFIVKVTIWRMPKICDASTCQPF